MSKKKIVIAVFTIIMFLVIFWTIYCFFNSQYHILPPGENAPDEIYYVFNATYSQFGIL